MLADAVAFAVAAHGSQRRKGKDVPYVAHLLGVASLVLEHGGTETQAVAGLLHDTLEDTATTVADLAVFGEAVVRLVVACTDAVEGEDRGASTSAMRKQRYVSHFPSLPADAALVSACDKLHNLRDMVNDAEGGLFADGAWPFNVSAAEQVAYYRGLADAFDAHGGLPAALVREVRALVERLARSLTDPDG